MFKCDLVISGFSHNITNDLKNWDDIELSLKRDNYDGVIRSFSTKFEFVNSSYYLLKGEYQSKYLSSSAQIVFYKRNNSWSWNEVFRCALDFSTYSDDGMVISINAIDNTLSAIIKAQKSTVYEYLVSDVYTDRLRYDRLDMSSIYNFTTSDYFRRLPGDYLEMYITSYNNEISKPYVETDTSERKVVAIIQDVPQNGIIVLFDVDVFLDNRIFGEFHPALSVDISISAPGHDYYTTIQKGQTKRVFFGFKITKSDFDSTTDKKIYVDIRNIKWDESKYYKISEVYFKKIHEFKITYYSRQAIEDIRVTPLNIVLSKLIESMTGETKYRGVIDGYSPSPSHTDRLSTTYIMAAESARNLPEAKLYTSYKKFCDFMECEFGYVPIISNDKVTFMHRDKLFISDVSRRLSKAVNNYQYSVNSSLIYSSVKVGYDKQDYESINGRDEFRFTNEFETGLKLTDNKLSLICPYRSDSYGIEFLVQKRGEDTTDSSSDNDVFIISCIEGDAIGSYLKPYRPYPANRISGLISPDTMFNLEYSPRYMLEANKSFIGACTKLLKFTSSDGNSDVSINGVKETDDFSIPNSLFTVGEASVDTSEIDIPEMIDGLIEFENKGELIQGYTKQTKFKIGKEKDVNYSLIIKNITRL